MSELALEINGLSHTYLPGTPAACQALINVSFGVEQASILALAGESGAGKSTLALYLCGLLRPAQAGQLLIQGRDALAQAPGHKVGLVFQYPQQQLFERYVGDDIAYGPRRMGLDGAELTRRVAWAMNLVGLDFETFVDRETFSLSGGEMRRAALAGVLAMQPRILVLDEATTGLDPAGQELIRAALLALRNTLAMTILLISNDMDEIAALADRVVLVQQGRTIAEGSTRDILSDAGLLASCALMPPTPMRILSAIQQAGVALQPIALSLSEAEEEIWQALHR